MKAAAKETPDKALKLGVCITGMLQISVADTWKTGSRCLLIKYAHKCMQHIKQIFFAYSE